MIGGDIAPDSPPMSGTESQIRREERREEKNSPAPQADADASPHDDADAFDDWWSHYPKKKDKGHAKKAYKAALKKTDVATLLDAVQQYAELARTSEPKFVPYPATWLNGERWTDEPETLPDAPAASIGHQVIGEPPEDLLRQHGIIR